MAIARIRDIDICHELRGDGPRLLKLWGTGADLRRPPTDFDRRLTDAFTVLAFDQRGMGRSGKPDRRYTMADYADDAAALMDAFGWDSAAVLGYSFGGMVAQELALRHPDRVENMVLMSTVPAAPVAPPTRCMNSRNCPTSSGYAACWNWPTAAAPRNGRPRTRPCGRA